MPSGHKLGSIVIMDEDCHAMCKDPIVWLQGSTPYV